MPEPPCRALQILLRIFSLLAVAAGLLLIFADKPLIVRIFLRPPEAELTTLLLSLLKEMGGMVLMPNSLAKRILIGVTDRRDGWVGLSS
jgi:hypothetical protein